jgi:DNA (cytosine-5)-methyltransferase 1
MNRIVAADLFCGAGGTSHGLIEACRELGREVALTAINHWEVAVATHTKNHSDARHLCASLDALNPRDLFGEGELDVLWASPECTHHSVARGGKPINDQSRATAWCVVRWAEALRPGNIFVENVPEFVTWGGIGVNGRPLKEKRGATFMAWVGSLESLGYRVEWRVLCAADYGDPTTRRRLFVQAVRGRRRIVWPEPSHAPVATTDMLGSRKPWRAAREIIDWSHQGQSIFERKRPLSPKTIARIWAGLEKFGLKPFIVPQQSNPVPKSVEEPLPTVCAEGSQSKLAEPFLLPQHSSNPARSIDKPVPAVTTTSRGVGVAQPYLIAMEHGGRVLSIDKPMPTVTTAKGGAIGVTSPFLIEMRGTSDSQIKATAHSLDKPLSAVTAGGIHHGVAEPFLIHAAHGGKRRARSIKEPMPTVAGNRGDVALVEPFVMSAGGPECAARSVSEPLGTVLTRDHRAVVTPALLPQNQGGALRPVTEPAPTVATAGAIALVEPFLVEYYGNGGAESVDTPLNTVTTKERHALVRPTVILDGQRYLLDIRFRMLQPKELAAAQGFPADYHFTGTKTEQVKQIGNAVPTNLARALVKAALSA